jgi:hypothetical protein
MLAVALPPAADYARQYASARGLQFAIFAVLAPTLITLGVPARLAAARRIICHHASAESSTGRAAAGHLLPFVALAIVWRVPLLLAALARYPWLTAAELATLTGAGLWLWLGIAGPTVTVPLPRPLRAAMAAAATWTLWIIAYVTGMSQLTLMPHSAGTDALNPVIDRQLTAAVLWIVPAICFAPAIYFQLVSWLGERDSKQCERPEHETLWPEGLSSAQRPLRDWRSHGALRRGSADQ